MRIGIIVLCMMVALFLVNTANAISPIDNSKIQVFGTLGVPQYPPLHTIDDNLDTFWHGTNGIQIGMTNYLAYRFSRPYSIGRIDFFSSAYLMGELDIQISQDSTNGLDGTWETIDHIDGDFNPPGGDFTRVVNVPSTSWVRFWMTYQGRGAGGLSPAFYLSEVDFYSSSPPICDIQMSHPDYITGDTVIAEVARLANPGEEEISVEIKAWMDIPDGSVISYVNTGADGNYILEKGLNQNYGPASLFQVTSETPRGIYQVGCRLLDPMRGKVLAEDLETFEVR